MSKLGKADVKGAVDRAVKDVKITDIHTHLYAPCFGKLLLWGVDELITYHYLIAEVFRHVEIPYETYWKMSKKEQADLIWKTLFIENSPYSEACRGVGEVYCRGCDHGLCSTRDSHWWPRYRMALSSRIA